MSGMIKTAKGEFIDMDLLYKKNQTEIALGNKSMNARGDLLKNGKVIKTVEERRQEYYKLKEDVKETVALEDIVINSDDNKKSIIEEEVKELGTVKAKKSKKSIDNNLKNSIIEEDSIDVDDEIVLGQKTTEEIEFE